MQLRQRISQDWLGKFGLASRGWQVGFAAAAPGDQLVPYAALRTALAALLGGADGATHPSVRAFFHPSGRRTVERFPLSLLAADLCRLLDRLCARAPVMIALDDVHRADPASHELIARMTAPAPSRPWSMLLAARSDEPGWPAPKLPAQVAVITVEPLAKPLALQLARQHLRAAGVADLHVAELAEPLTQWSRGNPLFLMELARQVGQGGNLPTAAGAGPVPDRIVELLERRLEACSEAVRAVLPIIALVGAHVDYCLIAALLEAPGADGTGMAEVLDELAGAHLAVSSAKGVRMAHPLWRHAALARLNPMRIASLHTRIADALDGIGGREQVAAGHRIAAFRSAGLVEHARPAARSGLAAGHAARALLADEAALQLFTAALGAFEVLPAVRRRGLRRAASAGWLELGHIHADRLALDDAAAAYRRAIALSARDDEYAAGYSALGSLAYKRGDLAEAAATYRRGRSMIKEGSTWAQARLGTDLSWVSYRQGDTEAALAGMRAAAGRFAATRDRSGAARCLDLLAVVLRETGQSAEAIAASDTAIALAERAGDPRLTPPLAVHRANILMSVGTLGKAEAEARRAGEAARRVGDRYVESVAAWSLADILDRAGDLPAALAACRAAATVLAELDNPVNHATCLAHQASLLRRLGREGEAAQAADDALRLATRVGSARLSAVVAHALAPH